MRALSGHVAGAVNFIKRSLALCPVAVEQILELSSDEN